MKYLFYFFVCLGLISKLHSAENSTPSKTDKPFTTIDSDLGDINYEKRIATFEGNVIAIDPQLKLTCAKMIVYLDSKSDEVAKIDAIGNVHMYHQGKEAIGEKARFTRETGIIVLTGTKPKLKDEKGNWIVSRGEGIIYDLHTKQMRVDKPTMELQPSGGTDSIIK